MKTTLTKRMLAAVAATTICLGANAETQTIGDYTWAFSVSGSTATITNVPSALSGDVVVPGTLTANGNSYTVITPGSFAGNTSITNITLPPSITAVGKGAFYGCRNLKKVYISDLAAWCGISFASGDANPFYHGADLYLNGEKVENLVIPPGVTYIADYAFYLCASGGCNPLALHKQLDGGRRRCDCRRNRQQHQHTRWGDRDDQRGDGHGRGRRRSGVADAGAKMSKTGRKASLRTS